MFIPQDKKPEITIIALILETSFPQNFKLHKLCIPLFIPLFSLYGLIYLEKPEVQFH